MRKMFQIFHRQKVNHFKIAALKKESLIITIRKILQNMGNTNKENGNNNKIRSMLNLYYKIETNQLQKLLEEVLEFLDNLLKN